jgi:ribose transport system ATP-binding protein
VMVGTMDTSAVTEEQLVTMLLGRELGQLYPERATHEGDRVLTVADLSGRIAQGLSFEVRRGEIVGLTGLVGMGHDEVPYLIFGEHAPASGAITVGGRSFTRVTPTTMRKAGIALLPADRQRASGVPRATVLENVTLPTLPSYFRGGLLRHRRERREVLDLLRRFDVRPPDPGRVLSTLSGGNQQKALLAKWLQTQPAVLLLHEPTQGVDIGSRKQIFQIIREVAESGVGIVIASAEYEDLANMCDRVLVMRRGRIVRELAGADLTEERIVEQCYLAA